MAWTGSAVAGELGLQRLQSEDTRKSNFRHQFGDGDELIGVAHSGHKPQRLRSGIHALCGHGADGTFSRSMTPDRPSGRRIPYGRARAPGEGEGQAVRPIQAETATVAVLDGVRRHEGHEGIYQLCPLGLGRDVPWSPKALKPLGAPKSVLRSPYIPQPGKPWTIGAKRGKILNAWTTLTSESAYFPRFLGWR